MKSLLANNPALSQPVAVFIALLGLATIIKTLIDGFTWAYAWHKAWGVLFVITSSVVCLSLAMLLIRRLMRNQPVITSLPSHYLSHKPTVHWDFEEPEDRVCTFQVSVKRKDGGEKTTCVAAPGTRFCNLYKLKELHGNLSVRVTAFVDGKKYSTSLPVETEIYDSAVHRVMDTHRLRVAVHTDPGDDVFCSYSDAQWHGFDIDMVKLLAHQLEDQLSLEASLAIDFIHYSWPAVIDAPTQDKVDFAIASISSSEERRKKYKIQFSECYLTSFLGVISRTGEGNLRATGSNNTVRLDDLLGKTVAVHHETIGSTQLEKFNSADHRASTIEVLTAYSNPELCEWLNNGKVDIVVYDFHRAFSMLEPGFRVQKLEPITDVQMDTYCLTFAPNNFELREHVNRIISVNRDTFSQMLEERIQARTTAV